MLPVELSNGICSLNPNVLRFAVSCVMEIDKNSGKVLNYDVFKSIIKSRIQMNYKSVKISEDARIAKQSQSMFIIWIYLLYIVFMINQVKKN